MSKSEGHSISEIGQSRLSKGELSFSFLAFILAGIGIMGYVLLPIVPEFLGLSHFELWFLDTRAILLANEVAASGGNVYKPMASDIFGRPHVYSEWWLGLRYLGLNQSDVFWMGAAWTLGFLLTAVCIMRVASWRMLCGALGVFLSPPVLLAINRGNNDLVVFALLAAGIWFGSRGSRVGRLGFVLMVGIAAGLKYYPAAALAALPLLPGVKGRDRLIEWGGALVVVSLILLLTWRSELGGLIPEPSGSYVLGARWLSMELGLSNWGWRWSPLIAVAGTAMILARTSRVAEVLPLESKVSLAPARVSFVVGAALLVGCYLVGSSFAYRLIFTVMLFPHLAKLVGRDGGIKSGRFMMKVLIANTGAVLWFDGIVCIVSRFLDPSDPDFLSHLSVFNWSFIVLHELVYWSFISLLMGLLFRVAYETIQDVIADCRREGSQ